MNEFDLFQSALDIEDPAARARFLQAQCEHDAALRVRVEALLSSHENQSPFLNTPVVEQVAEAEGVATLQIGDGSTRDDQLNVTAVHPQEPVNMAAPHDDMDDEISLGYLEPSTRPDSLGRLGHYEVFQVIGRGAFGTVLRAFDEKLHRVVAIKVLAPEMAATSPARKRFIREAQASAAIRHEHVVNVYAVEEKPLPYLVMEYIPGVTLQQRLDERGPLDVPAVLRLGRQIAEGLAAAHAQQLIHRDIKPGNILLETGVHDRVKITDFGLARAADDASLTQSGTIAGTPMYMAPEQALGHKLDPRADLFALGSVLYQMVSGRPPFRAPSALAVLKRVAEEAPRPISEIVPEVPQWLCDIITKLHAKNPDDRYQSAQEVAEVLADCEVQLKANAKLQDFSRLPAVKTVPPAKGNSSIAAGMIGTMVLLSVIIITILNKDGRTTKVEVPGDAQQITISQDGDALVKINPSEATTTGWPADGPKPAIAPFDAVQAKKHQEEWAAYLKVPVEFTNSIGMKFRLIPPGEFLMGSTPAEIEAARPHVGGEAFWQELVQSQGPQHRVVLTRPFYLGVHEVTQAQYERVTAQNPSHYAPIGQRQQDVAGRDTATFPVENVSWNDVAEYCSKLSVQEHFGPMYVRSGNEVTLLTGNGYRLPTEAEWEFACRTGTTTRFWTGDDDGSLLQAAQISTNSANRTYAVGGLQANPFGLYDMHGNVWEWVQDGWDPKAYAAFQNAVATNPLGIAPASSHLRGMRSGGSGYTATYCQSAFRSNYTQSLGGGDIGFRVALSVDAVKAARQQTPLTVAAVNAARELAEDRERTRDQVKQNRVSGQATELELIYAEIDLSDARVHLTQLQGDTIAHLAAFRNFVAFRERERELIVQQVNAGLLKPDELDRVESGLADARARQAKAIAAARASTFFTDADVQRIAALPAAEQVEEVRKELKRLNPDFDGTLKATIENDVVTGIEIFTPHVSDISPVRAFPRLTALDFHGDGVNVGMVSDLKPLKGMQLIKLTLSVNPVSDLTPLTGMPLTDLYIDNSRVVDLSPLEGMQLKTLNCSCTKVSSLAPLKGMPLTILWCNNTEIANLSPVTEMLLLWITIQETKVTDLSPLKGMPLTQIHLDFQPERDTEFLRGMSTLVKINDKPTAEFWTEIDQK